MAGSRDQTPDSTWFQNPIIRGFNPDPTICVVPATSDGPARFFLTTSSFDYFPGCPIYTSTDLVNWKLIGHALTRPSQLDPRTLEPGAGSWASTLRYHQDEKRWFLTTTLIHRYTPTPDERTLPRGFYLWTDNIWDDSRWSDPVYFDNPGFDQDLFWDDDGKVYLTTTARIANRDPLSKLRDLAIHVSEIHLPTGRSITPPVVIRQSQYGVAEGSHIVRKGKYYYMFVAEGGPETGYQECVFRSAHGVFGPWESQGKPLWSNGPDEEVQGTGHADIIEDDKGRWWAVFLGVRPMKTYGGYLEPQLGRESFLVKVDWVDDWPVLNEGRNITLATKGRDAVEQVIENKSAERVRWQANLNGEKLDLGWYQKHTSLKPCYTLADRPGHLRIYGSCYSLSSSEVPSLLLRKQESYLESFHATLQFNPRKAGYEAGIAIWWSMYSYATIGITAAEDDDGKLCRTLVCRRPGGQAGELKVSHRLLADIPENTTEGSPAVELCAEASMAGYKMHLKHEEGVGSFQFDSSELTVAWPVGGSPTGVMFGVYSCGDWDPVLNPADFSNIYVKEGASGAWSPTTNE